MKAFDFSHALLSSEPLPQYPESLPGSVGAELIVRSGEEESAYRALTSFLTLSVQYTFRNEKLSQQLPILESPLARLVEKYGVVVIRNCPQMFPFLLYVMKVHQAYDYPYDLKKLVSLSHADLTKKLTDAEEYDADAWMYADDRKLNNESVGKVSPHNVTAQERHSHRGLHHHYFGPVDLSTNGRPQRSHPYAGLWTSDEQEMSGPPTQFVETRAAVESVFSRFRELIPQDYGRRQPHYKSQIFSVRQTLDELCSSQRHDLLEILKKVFVIDSYLDFDGGHVLDPFSDQSLKEHFPILVEQGKATSVALRPGDMCIFSNRSVLHGRASSERAGSQKNYSAYIF